MTLKAELDRIRSIDLVDVMQKYGYEIERVEGAESIFQSELGHISINREKGVFSVDWSGRGGRGAIDLVMCVKDCTYKEAVDLLRCDFEPDKVQNAKAEYVRSEPVERILDEEKKLGMLMQKSPEQNDRVIDYLQSRGIPDSLISHCMSKGLMWANKFGSACFGHRDSEKKIKGMTVRGTIGSFKQCVGDKLKSFFSLKSAGANHLRVAVESPIDALSFLSLTRSDPRPLNELGFQACEVVSVAGNSIPGCAEIQVSALDADEAGELGSRGYLRLRPVGVKDWNEMLLRPDWKLLWRSSWLHLFKECKKAPTWLSDCGPAPEPLLFPTATEIRDSKKSKNHNAKPTPKIG